MDLSKFHETEKDASKLKPTWWDGLPEEVRTIIDDGYKSGIPKATILRWLNAEHEGLAATRGLLNGAIEKHVR